VLVPLQTTTRPTFWQVGPVGEAVFYYLAAVAILVFLVGVVDRIREYARGREDPIPRLDRLPRRVVAATRLALSNRKQFDRDPVAGLWHALVVWGFLTLLVATIILGIDMDIYRPLTGESFWVGEFYLSYSFVADVMGVAFVLGLAIALWRRYGLRLQRLWGRHTDLEDDLLVWSLFALGVGGFLTEGLRILGTSATRDVSFEVVSVGGWLVKVGLATAGVTPGLATAIYPVVWWSHALLALAFVAWIPYAKPLHMLTAFANVVTRDEQAGVRLPGVPADAAPEDIGPSTIEDFSWKQLLDHDACTKCGRCSDACPAKAAGRPLDPRDVILDLKAYREDVAAGQRETVPIVADGGTSVIDARTMESCVSCLACVDSCPVEIEHVTQFTEMHRRLTESGQMNGHVQDRMMEIFQQGNGFGEPEQARPDWTDDVDVPVPDAREEPVEVLWYVGDYPSYDGRNQAVAIALARVLDAADVSWGILYEDEHNDGNDVRRVGEEGLYETLLEDNAAAIDACEYDRIVTTDPHAYNTFKNEYPEFDAPAWTAEDVFHYTQVVRELVEDGRLDVPGTLEDDVTYHDPCHLGRYNGEYAAPRTLIEATGCTIHEMPRNRADSFCCGGGGGGVWMDFDDDPKPSEERLREATEDTGGPVDRFVVACPMCMTMYEDGRKTGGFEEDLEVVGITELLAEAIAAGTE
jgi:Fe-S oxidoreductase